jgi:site-specific recombinase XerD
VQGFSADCEARNLSPETLRIHTVALAAFQRYTPHVQIEDASPDDLRAFFATHLQTRTPGSVHQVDRVLKTFCRFLLAEGEIPANPMLHLRPPKVPTTPLEPVALADLRSMLSACDRRSFFGERDRAILLALLDTGCRAAEFITLNVGDADLRSGAVLVRKGKEGRAGV